MESALERNLRERRLRSAIAARPIAGASGRVYEGAEPGSPKLHRSAYLHGILRALAFPAWVVGISFLGVGSLARDAGFPLAATTLSTVLVWAAPAQVILFAGLAAGMALPSIALAVSLSSVRLLPMVMSVLPQLRRPGQNLGTQLLAAHCIAVTVWLESHRALPALPAGERLPFLFGLAGTMMAVSTALTVLGYHLVGVLPAPLAAGLLFVTPIFFASALAAGARRPADWVAIALGFGLTPLATLAVGKESDLLVAGLISGTAAYLVERGRRRP